MKKDVHIYLDYELSNNIENIAKQNNKSLSTTYTSIIMNGLTINSILMKLDLIYKLLLKNQKRKIDKLSD